jgi:hypothetical protein
MVRDSVAGAPVLAMLAEPSVGWGRSVQISSDQGRHDCPSEKEPVFLQGPEQNWIEIW